MSTAFNNSQALQPTQQGDPQPPTASPRAGSTQATAAGAGQSSAAPRELWSEAAELAEARERSQWHELMSRRNMEPNEKLQVKHIAQRFLSSHSCLHIASRI